MLQQDDLAVMVEDGNGEYRFQAGSICTAGKWMRLSMIALYAKAERTGFWRLEDKIGYTLHEIHTRGKVPQFETKLKFSMERWSIYAPQALYAC